MKIVYAIGVAFLFFILLGCLGQGKEKTGEIEEKSQPEVITPTSPENESEISFPEMYIQEINESEGDFPSPV
jgi:hypothetical protein